MVVRLRFPRAVAALVGLLVLPSVGVSDAATRYRVVVNSWPAPGLNYRKIVDSTGPNRIFVLTVDPKTALTMDVALAGNQLGHYERTSDMASRHGAIAAINGDFGLPPGYPVHGFAEDGDLKINRTGPSVNFAVSKDETHVYLDSPTLTMTANEVNTSTALKITKWNFGKPLSGQIVNYTPAGGSFAQPPSDMCYAQLATSAGLQWNGTQTGIVNSYTVDEATCQNTPPSVTPGAVLTAVNGTTQGDALKSLNHGEEVQTAWSFGWSGVMDLIGGIPQLVKDGVVVATNCSDPLCSRNPRTGVGIRSDGKLLLVVVDGRQSGYSVGMTLLEFAKLFRYLGAVQAMNLDGGGSSTMVLNGAIKNRPSDGFERGVTTALLVLPGQDSGEPTPAQFGTFSAAAAPEQPVPTDQALGEKSANAASLDPGSTGGMADALARGTLGNGPATLSPDLIEVLRLFRAANSR
jgi:exopolysaccharide biosynthesis protein